jgi:hypothetical protein
MPQRIRTAHLIIADDESNDEDGDNTTETSPGYNGRAEALGPNLSADSFIAPEDDVNDLSSTPGEEEEFAEDEDGAAKVGGTSEQSWKDDVLSMF